MTTAIDQLQLVQQHRGEPLEPVDIKELFNQRPELARDEGVDWAEVQAIVSRVLGVVEDQAAEEGEGRSLATSSDEMEQLAAEEYGRSLIENAVQDAQQRRAREGEKAWTSEEMAALKEAAFNQIYRLGRLQPLIDNDTVENIMIMGCDKVYLSHTDGSLSHAPAVANSDDELVAMIQNIASRTGTNSQISGRPKIFSQAHPTLRMTLPGGERLSAKAWVTPRPNVVIRRHRLVHVTLDDLVEREMFSPLVASFLRAAIKARLSIAVTGPQSSGKTTLLRAMCDVIPPRETIATFESQYELFLHQMEDRHPIVHAYEASEGTGELDAHGNRVGEFTLIRALETSMADFIQRPIVGEVIGPEIWTLVRAAESGAGALCTTHGRTAKSSMDKLVTCAMENGPAVTSEVATRKLSQALDLVVQVNVEETENADGSVSRRRWLSEIISVEPDNGDGKIGMSFGTIFGGPRDRVAEPRTLPHHLSFLEQYGFDLTAYTYEGGKVMIEDDAGQVQK